MSKTRAERIAEEAQLKKEWEKKGGKVKRGKTKFSTATDPIRTGQRTQTGRGGRVKSYTWPEGKAPADDKPKPKPKTKVKPAIALPRGKGWKAKALKAVNKWLKSFETPKIVKPKVVKPAVVKPAVVKPSISKKVPPGVGKGAAKPKARVDPKPKRHGRVPPGVGKGAAKPKPKDKPMSRTEKVTRSTLGLGTKGRRTGQAIRDKKGRLHGVGKKDQRLAKNIRKGAIIAGGAGGLAYLLSQAGKKEGKGSSVIAKSKGGPRKPTPPQRGKDPFKDMEDPTWSKPKPRVDDFSKVPKKPKKKYTSPSQEAKERKDQEPIQGRYRYFGKPGETIGDLSRKLEIKYDTRPPGSLPHEEGYEENKRGGQIKGYKKGGKVKKVRKASRPRGVGIAMRGWGKAMR